MNYLNLFQHQESLQGGDFICYIFREEGHIQIPTESTHPMIFVLQGSVDLNFNHQSESIQANELAILNAKELRYIKCQSNTIVLKYTPPSRLTLFLEHCFSALKKECSMPIAIRPDLQEWINDLLAELSSGTVMDVERCCYYRHALAKVIIEYPQEKLGEIYVPFYACTRNPCSTCRKK